MNAVSPWGGDDGGFANGATQGVWDVGEQLLPWYVLRWSGAVDLAGKAWVRNWARYQAYFMPPGQKSQVFGDGLEIDLTENRSRFGARLRQLRRPRHSPGGTPQNMPGRDPMRVESLLSPATDGNAARAARGHARTRSSSPRSAGRRCTATSPTRSASRCTSSRARRRTARSTTATPTRTAS